MYSFVKKVEYQAMGVLGVKEESGVLVVGVTISRESPGGPRHRRPVLAALPQTGPAAGVQLPVLLSTETCRYQNKQFLNFNYTY